MTTPPVPGIPASSRSRRKENSILARALPSLHNGLPPITAGFPPLPSFASAVTEFLSDFLPIGPASAALRHASEVKAPHQAFYAGDFDLYSRSPSVLPFKGSRIATDSGSVWSGPASAALRHASEVKAPHQAFYAGDFDLYSQSPSVLPFKGSRIATDSGSVWSGR
ncbi:GD24758 [Drosophila simulans]|uniref:GD24758 n=1 Tax=Drosophila simulans TaxID=7240 RepID=B4NV00_DROSI|nr:GD24758 [Drosophila simulans]